MLYIADFETTAEENTHEQKETEVWAFGIAQLFDGTEDVTIGNSIEGFFNELSKGRKKDKKIVYFVNLKFDGSFILDYLIRELGFISAYNSETKAFKLQKDLLPGELTYVITDLGIWYTISVNYKGYIIEFRDSLKLLPFSVNDLSKAFDTKYKKLDMEYKGERKAHGVITMEEREYLANDIRVPKEALEKFLTEISATRNPPLTIAQASLRDFRTEFTQEQWETLFPNLSEYYADLEQQEFFNKFGSNNADEYVRRSYYGGWCYCNEIYSGNVNGYTEVYDVNSLYPATMENDNNPMPIGFPTFTKDKRFLKKVTKDQFFIIRFKCKFNLRANSFPFIQLKYDYNYASNINLRTSNIDRFGNYRSDLKPELTLTSPMFKLFLQCYNIKEFEFLDACIFNTETGLFKRYVRKWAKKKIEAGKQHNTVKRTTCKLFLNSLYGRFGRNPDNTFKVIPDEVEEATALNYVDNKGENVKPLYIPIASAITSHARCYTVRSANSNFDIFRYSDTDSIHVCPDKNNKVKGLIIHDSDFGAWKLESKSEHSLFIRQKTYIEYSNNEYEIKACGMPERSKILFAENLKGNKPDNKGILHTENKDIKLSEKERKFFTKDLEPRDFKIGFSVPGKLLPKVIKGGTVLIETDFTIK